MNVTTKFFANGLLVLSVACSGGVPEIAYGRSLAGAVTNSVAKQARKRIALGKPKDVLVSRKQYPQAAKHIEDAQRDGQPTVLHIDRKGAPHQRKQSIGTVNRNPKPSPGYERDEYPPALTREGGSGSSVRFIDPHGNRGAGASIRAQTSDLPDGAKIRVLVTD